ncbi:uncharacterized protein [Salvelinus alpinus]|uniref:uncharacterized protein n=1 Tax=Salvelinus alpinus TaxID=8036 RepID=UPI0039FC807B
MCYGVYYNLYVGIGCITETLRSVSEEKWGKDELCCTVGYSTVASSYRTVCPLGLSVTWNVDHQAPFKLNSGTWTIKPSSNSPLDPGPSSPPQTHLWTLDHQALFKLTSGPWTIKPSSNSPLDPGPSGPLQTHLWTLDHQALFKLTSGPWTIKPSSNSPLDPGPSSPLQTHLWTLDHQALFKLTSGPWTIRPSSNSPLDPGPSGPLQTHLWTLDHQAPLQTHLWTLEASLHCLCSSFPSKSVTDSDVGHQRVLAINESGREEKASGFPGPRSDRDHRLDSAVGAIFY